MIHLGLRLALSGGRGAVAGLGLTATAVAIGSAILLFTLSFAPAVAERDSRIAWTVPLSDTNPSGTLILVQQDTFEGRPLMRVHLAPTSESSPIPAVIAAMPGPGEAYVSPALAALMQAVPADQLGDRIGRIVGTIDETGLASPDSLVAVIGSEPAVLRAQGASTVSTFATGKVERDLPRIGVLILVLAAMGALAPVAVFVSTATRMSAARRELRLAALRLVGATPAQVARLAVVEALVATSIGAVAGVALFVLVRPLVALIPLDGATWWPDTIAPPLAPAVAMLLAIQVVGAGGALFAMRRVTVTPLGVQRRSTAGPPSALRVLPLVLSIVSLLVAISLYRTRGVPESVGLAFTGIAFAAVIASLAVVGPWLTGIVGGVLHRRAAGAASLLAGRRLSAEPRGSFGAIAGVIMAVFVASAFFAFAAYSRAAAGSVADPLLQPNAAVGYFGAGARTSDLAERVAGVTGVTAAVPVRSVGLAVEDGFVEYGWVASCPDLVAAFGLTEARCAPSGINALKGFVAPGRYTVLPDTASADGLPPRGTGIRIDPGVEEPLVDGDTFVASALPAFIIDPSALDDPSVVTTFPVNRLYVTTDGSAGVHERVRTAIIAAEPASFVRLEAERIAENSRFQEIGRIVGIGLIGTLALAGCSLAVAVTTSTLDRRRQFAFLRSAGMPASALRATILLQAGVPLTAVAGASALLGAIVGAGILWITTDIVTLPDASLLGVIVLSVIVAMAVVALTLPPLERMTRPLSVRSE